MPVSRRTTRKTKTKASAAKAAPKAATAAPKAAKKVKWPEAVYDDRRGKLRPVDAYEVGRIIVEDLYKGDRPEHGRRGRTTFRRIAAEEMKGLMSAQALYRCAAIYEMCTKLAIEPYWDHIGMSHLSLVLGLTPVQQKRLIGQTEKQGWSVERLRVEAMKLRANRKNRKGRRPLPRFAKAIHQLERFTDGRESLLGDLDTSEGLSREKLEKMLDRVTSVKNELETVQKTLKKSMRGAPKA